MSEGNKGSAVVWRERARKAAKELLAPKTGDRFHDMVDTRPGMVDEMVDSIIQAAVSQVKEQMGKKGAR